LKEVENSENVGKTKISGDFEEVEILENLVTKIFFVVADQTAANAAVFLHVSLFLVSYRLMTS